MEEYRKKRAEELKKPWAVRKSKDAYWWFYRLFFRIKELPDTVKWRFQRLFRGYSDCDLWGLNGFIVEKLHAPIKAFVKYEAEHGKGIPIDFEKDPAGWLEVLYKIEYAFDQAYQEEITYTDAYHEWLMDLLENDKNAYDERRRKIDEGFQLFGKYLLHLWD